MHAAPHSVFAEVQGLAPVAADVSLPKLIEVHCEVKTIRESLRVANNGCI
jgi:hypothetical protein